jgi:hypothetical protein
VIRLYLHTTESVADTAATMRGDQQFANILSWEGHIQSK